MENLVQRFFVIVLVSLSAVVLIIANNHESNLEIILVLISVITVGLAFFLEKKTPFRKAWNKNIGDLKTDLSSAATLVILVDPIIKILLPLLVIAAYKCWNVEYTQSSLPFYIQVIVVTLVIEFGKYWSHRLHHLQTSLWWLHAMHHSSKRLYFMNNLRFHPVNYLINSVIGFTPVMLMGFSPNAILGYLVLTQPLVLIQHANIDLKSGWSNYLFSTNEAHRWHHSITSSEANSNYGNALLIWDHVFGTFRAPDGFTKEKRVGLFSSRSCYPENSSYWQQIKSMFVPPC
ncbi:sterol desaturase family protein [Colwellia psychrerythraea]|uniref:Fatty acid hydroxylase n=1 Tax=Colwellia psychrerythraea TaxID=28229 RepID=A0A099L1B3_COLPS|nr:sterol desaturase family protein [Colwellia psychrerythraea]KGJ95932.1 fatty acid hydroxylase [Colwellia psychrerythraea]